MTTTAMPPPSVVDDPNAEQVRVEQLRKRGLFPFSDGFRPRMADLIEVQLRIASVLPSQDMDELDYLLEVAAGKDAVPKPKPWDLTPTKLSVPAALVRLAEIVTTGFDLPPLDEATGQGLSVQEKVDLLSDFLATTPDEDEGEPDPETDDHPVATAQPASASSSTTLAATPATST